MNLNKMFAQHQGFTVLYNISKRWSTWYNLPVVKHREGESLTLCMSPEVCLKTKGVDGRHEGLDRV
jgi:hypothetical protein